MTDPKPLQPAYEASAVRVGAVVIFTVATTVGTGLLMAAMVWLYGRYEARVVAAASEAVPATLIERPADVGPPDPVLQGAPGSRFELEDPAVEMERQRERMARTLHSAEVGRTGEVRIPIEHAKKLVIERGLLPVRGEERGGGGKR